MIQEYVDIFVDSSIMKIRGLNRLEDLVHTTHHINIMIFAQNKNDFYELGLGCSYQLL